MLVSQRPGICSLSGRRLLRALWARAQAQDEGCGFPDQIGSSLAGVELPHTGEKLATTHHTHRPWVYQGD